jgi:hypothetical protein
MFVTEQNGTQMWSKMLKENFNVTDNEKLNWVSQYASIHEIYESNLGVNGGAMVPGANGVGPMYTTPLNTTGMGNPAAPGYVNGQVPMNGKDFRAQSVGSGELPLSTLPMALNVALMTIGLELVPVVPTKGPWALLSYMDFPYAGGKLNVAGNLTSFDGKGTGRENKPLYVKFLANASTDFVAAKAAVKAGDTVTVAGNGVTFTGIFKDWGRMDGGMILETVSCVKGSDNVAIADLFVGDGAVEATAGAAKVALRKVDFAQTMVDFIDGFANFATGKAEPMSRAENETGTGNTIGLRLFSKWIQVGSYEVTGTVTRQQLQDLPLYGTDAVGKVMEAMQNELTQSINARILERVFALGVTNAVNQKLFQGVDLNLWMGTADTQSLADTTIKHYRDIDGVDHKTAAWKLVNSEVNTSAENLHTRQRRIASRILAATNLIQVTGRRGRATWVVTNAQVATALQDCSGYVVAPMANTMSQDGTQNLYLAGTLAGLKVYVDPYMTWEDTRVCVGRKGDANSPGVVFMPYILADQVTITAEGTMAPKMLVNSRYALADAGFYPETQYYTFAVHCPDFGII